MNFKNGYLAIALMSGLSVVACSNTTAGAKKDAAANAEKAAVATDRAAEKADPAVDRAQAAGRDAAAETREAARETGAAAKDAGREAAGEAGRATAAAIETIDVKSALMADRTVDASRINVDTIHQTRTVVLKGSVRSASQRDEAARIAAAEAQGYRIDNQLTVVANP